MSIRKNITATRCYQQVSSVCRNKAISIFLTYQKLQIGWSGCLYSTRIMIRGHLLQMINCLLMEIIIMGESLEWWKGSLLKNRKHPHN